MILVATILRIVWAVLDVTENSEDDFGRHFNNECLDTAPYHALLISAIIIGVDLMPPFLFTKIFTVVKDKSKINY